TGDLAVVARRKAGGLGNDHALRLGRELAHFGTLEGPGGLNRQSVRKRSKRQPQRAQDRQAENRVPQRTTWLPDRLWPAGQFRRQYHGGYACSPSAPTGTAVVRLFHTTPSMRAVDSGRKIATALGSSL